MIHSRSLYRVLVLTSLVFSFTSPAYAQEAEDEPDAEAEDPVSWEQVKAYVDERLQLSFYGFARLDMHYSDSRFNDPRAPMFVISEGNNSFVQGQDRTQRNVDDGTFVMHPRLSRFGFTMGADESVLGARLSGKMEIDFFSPGSESRPVPRMRHFFGKLDWEWAYLLFGQTTDLASPLYPAVNWESLMWNAGNLGDRQPQLQVGLVPRVGSRLKLMFQAAAGQEGGRTNADIDDNGVTDGDDSAQPQLQGRAGFAIRHWVDDQPIEIAGWGVRGTQQVVLLSPLPPDFSDETDFVTLGVGVDFTLPLFSFLTLKGEAWQGKNLADLRGGIGHVIDTRTGTEIHSRGGWVEMLVTLFDSYRLAAGASIDDPEDEDVPARGQRSQNRVLWVGNAFYIEDLTIGLDYTYWRTEWTRQNPGTAHRYSSYLMYQF